MNSKLRRGLRNLASALITIMICVMSVFAIINVVFNFVYIRSEVYQQSMQPTLNQNIKGDEPGDIVYCNKYSQIRRGDIVIASVKWHNKYIIKRLVGIPGDEIEIVDNGNYSYSLLVNNELVYSRSVGDKGEADKVALTNYYNSYKSFLNNNKSNVLIRDDGTRVIKLNENDYFLMGDNWAKSTDSIEHGPEGRNSILGRVEIIIRKGENRYIEMGRNILRMLLY